MDPVSEKKEPGYLHAWKGLAFVIILLALLFILGSYVMRPASETPLSNENGPSQPVSSTPNASDTSLVPATAIKSDIELTGTQTCLAHKNTSGPQTMECAIGLKADDGYDYGLDMSAIKFEEGNALLSGGRVRITGHFTPEAAIPNASTNRYTMRGIVQVKTIEAAP